MLLTFCNIDLFIVDCSSSLDCPKWYPKKLQNPSGCASTLNYFFRYVIHRTFHYISFTLCSSITSLLYLFIILHNCSIFLGKLNIVIMCCQHILAACYSWSSIIINMPIEDTSLLFTSPGNIIINFLPLWELSFYSYSLLSTLSHIFNLRQDLTFLL